MGRNNLLHDRNLDRQSCKLAAMETVKVTRDKKASLKIKNGNI
jgi:hypothetical protein